MKSRKKIAEKNSKIKAKITFLINKLFKINKSKKKYWYTVKCIFIIPYLRDRVSMCELPQGIYNSLSFVLIGRICDLIKLNLSASFSLDVYFMIFSTFF